MSEQEHWMKKKLAEATRRIDDLERELAKSQADALEMLKQHLLVHGQLVEARRQRDELQTVLRELVSLQDVIGCVWRTSPIMDRIRNLILP